MPEPRAYIVSKSGDSDEAPEYAREIALYGVGGGEGGGVLSVNGKSGIVTLDADDVNALPDTYTPPVTSVNGREGDVVVTLSELGGATMSAVSELESEIASKVSEVVAGANVTIDSTDPTRPVISASGGGGGGAVDSVNGKTGAVVLSAEDVGALPDTYTPPPAPVASVNGEVGDVVLDAADVGALPDTYQAPVSSVNGQVGAVTLEASDVGAVTPEEVSVIANSKVSSVQAGANVTVDNTDPLNPVISATGGGTGGAVDSVNGQTGAVVLDAADVGALPDTYVPPEAPVQSVAGKTGDVTLAPADVGATIVATSGTIPLRATSGRLPGIGTAINATDAANKSYVDSQVATRVSSVNGKTGAVTLGASDVEALPDTYTAPVTSVAGKTGDVALDPYDVNASATGGVNTLPIRGEGNRVSSIGTPVTSSDAANKFYVDSKTTKLELLTTPQDFGAVGDGVADDTAAWNAFQADKSIRFVPAGRYLVDGAVKRFDQGVFGNGEFLDADSAWDQPRGDRERDSILVHRNYIDVNTQTVSPIIKTQTQTNFQVDQPGPASFKHVIGAYHEGTLDGYYNISTDTNQNFTVFGATTRNRMAGLFGSLAGLFYAQDATEEENPLISTMGATKNGATFLRFTRKARFDSGGYMFGQEIYCMNSANETVAVPYTNNDEFSWPGGSWTSGIKVGVFSSGAPISSAMFTHGSSTGLHGFWNGIVIGGSGFKINGQNQGVSGTVGLNLASWRTAGGFGDIGIKFRTANRHIYFNEGAKIRSSHTRFTYESGSGGVSIESNASGTPYLNFRQGATGAADGGPVTDVAVIDAGTTRARIHSVGEVHLSAASGSAIYLANSARFAPAAANDGTQHLGDASRRWNTIYAVNSTISTSDERAKTEITEIPDAVLDAWGDVNYSQYRMVDAVQAKGDGARLHTGLIAQRVQDIFSAHGLDAAEYGLLCYDEWEAKDEVVEEYDVEIEPAVYEQVLVKEPEFREEVHEDGTTERIEVTPAEYEDGELITPAVVETRTSVTPAVEAGSLYGIRYEEAQALEAAYQRRRADRAEARIARIEAALGLD